MDEWVEETMKTKLSGIEARWWVRFLKLFDERGDEESITDGIKKLASSIGRDDKWVEDVMSLVRGLMQL